MAEDPFKDLYPEPNADPFADLVQNRAPWSAIGGAPLVDPIGGPPGPEQPASPDDEATSASSLPSPMADRPSPAARVSSSEPDDPFSDLTPGAEENPFRDLEPGGDAVARDESRGFLNNLRLSDLQRAANEESMAANLMKWITGNTDEKQREITRRFQTDRTERELDDIAEHWLQAEGYDGENYQAAQAALDAYREARTDPDFDLDMVKAAFQADPGQFMAEITKFMIIDPQLMLTPLGWSRAALAAERAAKAAGASKGAARAARVPGGAAGAAATGAAIEAPISTARQLGESGEITDPGRIGAETGFAAAGSSSVAGVFKGVPAGIRAARDAARSSGRRRLDEDIRRSTTPDEATTSTRQTQHGEVVEGDRRILTELPRSADDAGPTELGEVRELPAPEETPPAQPEPDPARARAARADELERLARATPDAELRQDLQRQARQLRAEAAGDKPKRTPQERYEEQRKINLDQDDLVTVIRKLGGLNVSESAPDAGADFRTRLSHLPNKGFGLPAIEQTKGGGLTLDELSEQLTDLGFLNEMDSSKVYELLDRASGGEEIFSLRADPDRVFEDLLGDRPDAPVDPLTDEDYIFHRPGTDPGELDTDFVIDSDTATVQPARPIDLDDLQRLEAEEANARQWFEDEAASARAEEAEGSPGDGGRAEGLGVQDGAPDPISGRPRVQPGDGPRDPELGGRLSDTDEEGAPPVEGARDDARPRLPGDRPGRDRPITENTAERVAEALRFGQRVRHTEVDRLPTAVRQVRHPEEVAHLSARLRKDPQETVMVVATDDAGKIVRLSRLTRGSQRSASAHPGLVAATGVSAPGARRLWVVHNHPSGNPKHSRADTDFAENMQDLLRDTGVNFEGSLVVASSGRFTHFHPNPKIRQVNDPKPIPAGARGEQQPVSERRFTRSLPARTSSGEPVPSVRQPGALESITDGLGGQEGLVLTNNLGQPQAFVPLTRDQMQQLRDPDTFRRVASEFDATNATGFAARINSDSEEELARVARNLEGFSSKAGYTFHDVVSPTRGRASDADLTHTGANTFYANPFLVAGGAVARGIGDSPGRAAASAFSGGVGGATLSDEEVGSPQWWADVALGASAGLGLSHFVRATNLLGRGSIVDNNLVRLGNWIEGLPLIGRGPPELQELKRKQRLMKEYIERQTAEMGRELLDRFSPSERAMMADLIENRGIIEDLNLVHQQAQALDEYLTFVTQRMKELGMLTEDMAEGGYLHRYYAKHLGLDGSFRQAKKQSLSGSYTISRGKFEPKSRQYMSPRAQQLADQYDLIKDELELVKKRGDLLDDDPELAARREALREDLDELKRTELVEYTGLQDGKLRSFFFRRDELARVDAGDGDVVQAFRHEARPGEIDDRLGEILPGVEKLTPTDRVWTVRGSRRDGVLLHRDWTKAERQSWGEIDDAGYRFVRGMAEVAHDLSLATLYENVARKSDWVSETQREGWVQVPATKVHKNSPLQKYGQLAGKWVEPKIWNGMKRYGRNTLGESRLAKRYIDLNNKWKVYKTVYNPVTHINNTYSNIEMLLMSDHTLGDLVEGWQHMRQAENSQVWREASNAGLFGNDFTTSVIRSSEGGNSQVLSDLAEQLRNQSEIPDAELATGAFMRMKEWWINSRNALDEADGAWGTGAALAKAMGRPFLAGLKTANKPVKAATRAMTRAYRFEDNVFKMAAFAAARRQGKSIDESVHQAQGLFFDYQDLPDAMRMVRDLPIGSPFISYTYFASQAIVRNAVRNPEKVLALVAGYEAMNFAALVADGMSPGEYWAVESAEEDLSPPWDRGRSLWGAKNTVRIPGLDGYRIAMGRAHALGNPFMTDAGGREKLPTVPYITNFWGSSIFGSSPAHALLDISVNEDWRGKEIYQPGDPDEEKIQKSLNYLFQAWSPSNALFPGSYHQQRILEGLANQARTDDSEIIAPVVDAANGVAEALGWEQFTGLNRVGDEVKTSDAVLASFGIKLRPIDHEMTLDFEQGKLNRDIRAIEKSIDNKARLFGEDRITPDQLDTAVRRRDENIEELTDEQIHLENQADVLREQGLFRRRD